MIDVSTLPIPEEAAPEYRRAAAEIFWSMRSAMRRRDVVLAGVRLGRFSAIYSLATGRELSLRLLWQVVKLDHDPSS